MTTATAGAGDTSPPAVPARADVVMRLADPAVTARSPPPVSAPMNVALVLSSTSATETDAPMPTESAPTSPAAARALVVIVELEAADTDTSPDAPASTLA